MIENASTWERTLSFRINGMGEIALYDEMAEETLIVEAAEIESESAMHAQLQRMLRTAAEFMAA